MNKQRNVVITTTYNEMGIIIDTKAEEVAQPDLCDGCDRYGASCVGEGCGKLEMPEVAKDTNAPINDCISRQMAIDALDALCQEHRYRIPGKRETYSEYNEAWQDALDRAEGAIGNLPSAQPDNSCDGCRYENADDGVLVPCGFCKRSHPDNYEGRTDERTD